MLLFLALGVLAPAACVLWFMNEAMTNQRDAARQKLAEAYRGQLQLVRDRLDADWEKRAAGLDRAAASGAAPAAFEQCIRNGLADTVVFLNPDGSVAYPSAAIALRADPLEARPDWMAARSLESQRFFSGAADSYSAIAKADRDASVAARAMQAHIRCLLRNGATAEAIRAVQEQFTGGRLLHGTDAGGQLVAADEQLLALTLIDRNDPRYLPAAQRLHAPGGRLSGAAHPRSPTPVCDGRDARAGLGADIPTSPRMRRSGWRRSSWKCVNRAAAAASWRPAACPTSGNSARRAVAPSRCSVPRRCSPRCAS